MNSLFLALHLTAVSLAGAADTQQPNSWSAWYGCWQAEGAPANEMICIAPTKTGVRISTLVDGAVQDESNINTDGLSRRVQTQGCTGSERARWSSDRQRVFLDSDVACGGAGRRTVRGMFAFVAPEEWISVQSTTDGDSVATRVVRFYAVDSQEMPARAASFAVARPASDVMFSVEERDVSEAVEHMGALAADEWMREAGEPFQLGYKSQDRGTGSALDQVGRFSNPVPVREVVRVVERPVYVHNSYYDDHYHWHYSPWHHHHHHYRWHWVHRPIIVVRLPIVIHRNVYYQRDYYRYRHRYYGDGRYGRYDRYDRYDGRRDRDNDRDYDRDRGRVTRAGYSSGRARERTETTTSPIRQVDRTPRATNETRDRSTEPRVRTSTPRDRTTETRERTTEPRERTSEPRVNQPRVNQPRERTSEPRVSQPRDRGQITERSTQSRERASESRERSSSGESARSSSGSRSSSSGSRTARARTSN